MADDRTIAERIAAAVDDGQGSGSTGYRMTAWKPAYVTAQDVCKALSIDPSARGVLLVAPHPPRATEYDEVTDCPICPQLATDRDDALIALGEVEGENELLRRVFTAAWAWMRTKYAMHGNTAEASRRHYEGVSFAESHLRGKVEEAMRAFGDPSAAGRFVGVEPPREEPT